MLDLRRLRLLHELHRLGTVSAVADALSYSPSTVSQQLQRARARGRHPAVRARRPARAAHRRGARARRARRAAARRRRARRGRPRGGRRRRGRGRRARRLVPDREPAPAAAGDERAARRRTPASGCGSSRPSPSRRWRRCARTRSTSRSPTSGPARRTRAGPGLDREDLFTEAVRVALPSDHPAAERAAPVPLADAGRRAVGDRLPGRRHGRARAARLQRARRLRARRPPRDQRADDAARARRRRPRRHAAAGARARSATSPASRPGRSPTPSSPARSSPPSARAPTAAPRSPRCGRRSEKCPTADAEAGMRTLPVAGYRAA